MDTLKTTQTALQSLKTTQNNAICRVVVPEVARAVVDRYARRGPGAVALLLPSASRWTGKAATHGHGGTSALLPKHGETQETCRCWEQPAWQVRGEPWPG